MKLSRAEIVEKDKRYAWHPYTAMETYIASTDPIVVARAKGAHLEDVDGKRYIDGNSSWWVAGLGHGHPRLLRALREQSEALAHCAFAGITHEPAARLAEELVAVAPPGLSRVFYTDNGSTSIEVALRIAVQTWRKAGRPEKTRFLALDGAFHGETLGATALGGVEIFRRAFAGMTLDCVHAPPPVPGDGASDGAGEDVGDDAGERRAYARAFETLERLVVENHATLAAIVIEPIVQGASGMRMYPPEYLAQLRELATRHDVLLVVDEVFTGYGRTGPMWASEHAGISPDVLCIGKTFSSLVPMGATLVSDRVFDAFRGEASETLFYGHTFCGNPLGAALAREVLAIFREEDVLAGVARRAPMIAGAMRALQGVPGVARVRSLGMIGAVDLAPDGGRGASGGYLGALGWRVYKEARARGAYLRPLGDTVYVCPPLVIEEADLAALLGIFDESVRAAVAGL